MSEYAIHEATQTLIGMACGGGHGAAWDVLDLRQGPRAGFIPDLVLGLSEASRQLWGLFEGYEIRQDEELLYLGELQQQREQLLEGVLDVLEHPGAHLPSAISRHFPVVIEAVCSLAELLRLIGDTHVTASVRRELAAEVEAVRRAMQGDFRGRACQALDMTTVDMSPVQVMAASDALETALLAPHGLLVDIHPASACVAASFWLACAVSVAGEMTGVGAERVLADADDVDPLDYAGPQRVLDLMEDSSPREAVVELIVQALRVRTGNVADPDLLMQEVTHAVQRTSSGRGSLLHNLEALMPFTMCVLDVRQPARFLLQDLLACIRACSTLYGHVLIARGAEDESGPTDVNELAEEFTASVRALARLRMERLYV